MRTIDSGSVLVTSRSYSGKSAVERESERRARLLDAGLEFFGTVGFATATIEDICRSAKVSTRHYYQIHTNKEDLLLDVYDAIATESRRRADASLVTTHGRTLRERVGPAYLAYISPMIQDRRIARIAFVEIIGASAVLETKRRSYREMMIQFVQTELEAAIADGEIEPADFRFKALALAGASNAVIYDWVQDARSMSAAELTATLGAFAIDLLTT